MSRDNSPAGPGPSGWVSRLAVREMTPPDLATAGIQSTHSDGFTSIGANLKRLCAKSAIEYFEPVKRGLACNAINLRNSLLHFLVQGLTV